MIKMYHDDSKATGGPTVADVPEGGVDMMRRAGWYTKGVEVPGKTVNVPAAENRKALDKMNHEELDAEVTRMGIAFPEGAKPTKAEKVAFIQEHADAGKGEDAESSAGPAAQE
jgi:hypothetical protein